MCKLKMLTPLLVECRLRSVLAEPIDCFTAATCSLIRHKGVSHMKLTSFLSHHSLVVRVLALAIALSALALTPTVNAQKVICDTGCVAWDAQNGCTRYMSCCVA